MSDWLGATAGFGMLAGAAFFGFRHYKKQSGSHGADFGASAGRQPVAALPAPIGVDLRPRSQLPILTALELIDRTGCAGLVEELRTLLGFLPANYASDVVPLIARFAEFAQLLPASESHHHAQPGGLLQHSLETAVFALKARRGYKLPTGSSPEEQMRLGPSWSYGILVAALLHDIGKPVSDVVITLYGKEPSRSLGVWNGLTGSMLAAQAHNHSSHYRLDFPSSRDYQAHQRLPAILLHVCVPSLALQWLGTDARLYKELLQYLDGSGETAGGKSVFKEIVGKADQLSVIENLKTGSRIRFAAARNAPLIERLMGGLKALLLEGHVAMNRPGAPVFIDGDLKHFYMVAGKAADSVRTLLEQREARTTGAAGIPTDNTRIFDTWSEYGALVTPPAEFGKGSVWWIELKIDDWHQVLSVLKFPLSAVYAKDATLPAAFAGTITPVPPPSTKGEKAKATSVGGQDGVSGEPATVATPQAGLGADGYQLEQYDAMGAPLAPESNLVQENSGVAAASQALGDQGFSPLDYLDAPDAAAVAATPVAPTTAGDFLSSAESAGAVLGTGPAQHSAPVQVFPTPKQMPTKPPKALFRNKDAKNVERPNAARFMAWVQRCIGDGEFTVNESTSPVHFVAEGMLLVTPRIFKLYLENPDNAFQGPIGASVDALRALQTEVQKAGYVARDRKTSFHTYQTLSPDGAKGRMITTYLVPNPEAYIRPVPSPNMLLVKADGSESGQVVLSAPASPPMLITDAPNAKEVFTPVPAPNQAPERPSISDPEQAPTIIGKSVRRFTRPRAK